MRKVVLGGGMASGKSTVARLLRGLGAEVLSLDEVAAEVRDRPDAARELAERFGEDILDEQGRPVPALLAQRAFASAEATAAMNAIIHPRVAEVSRAFFEEAGEGAGLRVIEVPLLDKTPELIELADEVLVVHVPAEERVARAVGRGMDEADARRRIAAQASDEELQSLATTVIENNGTLEDLTETVRAWYKNLTGM